MRKDEGNSAGHSAAGECGIEVDEQGNELPFILSDSDDDEHDEHDLEEDGDSGVEA
jgi:hypothetical protein